MVKLRKSHNKLKIILCSVLGAIVAVGGVLGIWKLSTALSGDKVIDAPDNTVSVTKELPAGILSLGGQYRLYGAYCHSVHQFVQRL